MRASTDNLVEVLNDYGFLHLHGESPYDHTAEARGDDLGPVEFDAAPIAVTSLGESNAARVRELRYNDLDSIAAPPRWRSASDSRALYPVDLKHTGRPKCSAAARQ